MQTALDDFAMTATGFTGGPIGPPDLGEVRRACAVLFDPSFAVRLQTPGPPCRQLPAADTDAVVKAVAELADEPCVYWHLNPLALDAQRANVGDHVCWRWFCVDVDRKAGKEYSASDADREGLRGLALDVMASLGEAGWPCPVQLDSGNGFHLLWRISLPNDELSRATVKFCLGVLANRFAGEERGEIDDGLYKITSGSKVPGTWARNRKQAPDRPWRKATLLYVPFPVEVVPAAMLTELARSAGPELVKKLSRGVAGAVVAELLGQVAPAQPPTADFAMIATTERNGVYVARVLEIVGGEIAMAPPGQRERTLQRGAARLGQLVGSGDLEEFRAVDKLYIAACLAGLDTDPNCGERHIRDTIARNIAWGKENPRGVPEPTPERNGVHRPTATAAAPKSQPFDGTKPVIVFASTIPVTKVEWLWHGRIPLGKLTTFAGHGGLGKTFVLTDIAARVTRGAEWPDGTANAAAGSVLYISGEDDPSDTLVPRMMAAGADLDRIAFLTPLMLGKFTLADLPLLTAAANQMQGCRLLAIDPPTAYLGGINDHRNAELRSLLTPLAEWAAHNHVAVVFITHVNKPQAAKTEAIMRVLGSVAWTNAVRAAHMFAKDPDDDSRRIFVGMKGNNAKERKGLAYRLVQIDPADEDSMARVEWLGDVDLSANDAVGNEAAKPKKRSVAAGEWLEELFAETFIIPSGEIFKIKKAETNISDDALREAKDLMGIRARQECDGDGKNRWVWVWDPDAKARWKVRKERAAGKTEDEESF